MQGRDRSCLWTRVALVCSRFLRKHSQSGCIVLKEKPPAAKMSSVADVVHHRHRRHRRHRRYCRCRWRIAARKVSLSFAKCMYVALYRKDLKLCGRNFEVFLFREWGCSLPARGELIEHKSPIIRLCCDKDRWYFVLIRKLINKRYAFNVFEKQRKYWKRQNIICFFSLSFKILY